jgi:hypothetical protein
VTTEYALDDLHRPAKQRMREAIPRLLPSTPRREHGWDCASIFQGDVRARRDIPRECFYPLMIAHPTAHKRSKRLIANDQANGTAGLSPLNGLAALLHANDH